MLDAAWEAGVRHFEVARSYGRAEEFLGDWLRSRRPEGAVVSSKWGYVYTAGWRVDADPPEGKHHDVEAFRRQLAEPRSVPDLDDLVESPQAYWERRSKLPWT